VESSDNSIKNIAIVAGETSGDILGAGLIRSLKQAYPEANFWGVGGDKMAEEGFQTLYPMDRLSVMGIFEPLKRLPELLKMRRAIIDQCLLKKPDIFVGIDSPDFNLAIEQKLKNNHIKTIHYVGPSVWAWRQNRIHKIKSATDLVLLLFPFEKFIYEKYNVNYECVGHLAAQQIPLEINKYEYREKLGLGESDIIVAILPGSRDSVIKYHTKLFAQSALKLNALWAKRHKNKIIYVTSMPSEQKLALFKKSWPKDLEIKCFVNQSRDVLGAADTALLASGTVSLEAMLMKTPMVVAYKMSALAYFIAKLLVKTKYIALPNLIAQEEIVPEMIQDKAKPNLIAEKMLRFLVDLGYRDVIEDKFTEMHKYILKDTHHLAASAVLDVLNKK
jgi:lipid-A-disaccharide synthase